MIRPCLRRLRGLEDDLAVHMIAHQSASVARQLCLYAMMRDSRLVAEFMVTVIGEKYRQHDTNFSRADIRIFFLHLVEQNDQASTWTEATIKKLSSVLMSILVQNGYLANPRAKELQPVILQSPVRDAIKRHHDEWMLPAFHVL